MMISPDTYINMLKDKSYNNLIKKRETLYRNIHKFEKNPDKNDDSFKINPSPEVTYQMNLKYLSKICELIAETYKHEPKQNQREKPDPRELLDNIQKLHTTELGIQRIKKNLFLKTDNIVNWCKEKIKNPNALITKQGKNWYVSVDNCKITINAKSFTIITAHLAHTR